MDEQLGELSVSSTKTKKLVRSPLNLLKNSDLGSLDVNFNTEGPTGLKKFKEQGTSAVDIVEGTTAFEGTNSCRDSVSWEISVFKSPTGSKVVESFDQSAIDVDTEHDESGTTYNGTNASYQIDVLKPAIETSFDNIIGAPDTTKPDKKIIADENVVGATSEGVKRVSEKSSDVQTEEEKLFQKFEEGEQLQSEVSREEILENIVSDGSAISSSFEAVEVPTSSSQKPTNSNLAINEENANILEAEKAVVLQTNEIHPDIVLGEGMQIGDFNGSDLHKQVTFSAKEDSISERNAEASKSVQRGSKALNYDEEIDDTSSNKAFDKELTHLLRSDRQGIIFEERLLSASLELDVETTSEKILEKSEAERFLKSPSLHDHDSSESLGKSAGTSILRISNLDEHVDDFYPYAEEKQEAPQRKSSANKAELNRPDSRPPSRRSDKSQPSRPSSRKTDRPSYGKPETPPMLPVLSPFSRHKRKNLETSPAMLELFGVHVTPETSKSDSYLQKRGKDSNNTSTPLRPADFMKRAADIVDPNAVQTSEVEGRVDGDWRRTKRGKKHKNLFERTEFNEPGPEYATEGDSSFGQPYNSDSQKALSMVGGSSLYEPEQKMSQKKLSLQTDSNDSYGIGFGNGGRRKVLEERRTSEPGPEYYSHMDDSDIVGRNSLGDNSKSVIDQQQRQSHNDLMATIVDDSDVAVGKHRCGSRSNSGGGDSGNGSSSGSSSTINPAAMVVRDAEADTAQSGVSGRTSCAGEPARDMTAPAAAAATTIVVRGAQIVNDDSIFCADVLIEDGIIKLVFIFINVDYN